MTVDISGILTKIVGVEGKQLLTNLTANFTAKRSFL